MLAPHDFGPCPLSEMLSLRPEIGGPSSDARGALGAVGGGAATCAWSCAFGATGALFGTGDGAVGTWAAGWEGGGAGRLSGALHTFEGEALYDGGRTETEPKAGT